MTSDKLMRWVPVFGLIAFTFAAAAFFFLLFGVVQSLSWLLGISFAFSALGIALIFVVMILTIGDFWGK